jgi:formiminoglutamate deiminase
MYILNNLDGKGRIPVKAIFAKRALGPDGWLDDVRISIDNGRFSQIETGQSPQPDDEMHALLLPGMGNLHSHAFQRAMAGLAEMRGPGDDSFWSWRNVMYRFALSMTPDQVEAVAAKLYVEMLEAGFTRVGEFHYLHHDKDGGHYADIGEMAGRIAAAAGDTGIGLTLLPVFYAHSGFGGQAPADGQRRFINDLDGFARLLDSCRRSTQALDGAIVGVAPHSLRAVTPEELAVVATLLPDAPVHIHVAEQVLEVDDCIQWSGARPVEWLLSHADIDRRWCLIHATHMTDGEARGFGQSGAVAGLCPITEANLGDGTFPVMPFMDAGGSWGIGSDSNVLIGLPDELRQLEYSERLAHRARNVVARPNASTGRRLFDAAIAGGGRALGAPSGLVAGHSADFVSLRPRDVDFADDRLLDRWIFADGADIDCVWVRGVKRVSEGRHSESARVSRRFERVMAELVEGL